MTVKVGQIWKDSDPRCKHERLLRIESVRLDGLRPCVEVQRVCRVNDTWCALLARPSRRIQIKRFRPVSNGYTLVMDVE